METSTSVSKEEDSENNNNKMVDKSPNHHNHSRKPVDWQITKQNLSERGQYLLETGIWSDCTFVVGLPPNLKVSTTCNLQDFHNYNLPTYYLLDCFYIKIF